MNKILLSASVMIILVVLHIVLKNYDSMRSDSEMIISKIEKFRTNKHRLPESLSEIGVKDVESGPIYYRMIKTNSYVIYYSGEGVGESIVYYSERKEWARE